MEFPWYIDNLPSREVLRDFNEWLSHQRLAAPPAARPAPLPPASRPTSGGQRRPAAASLCLARKSKGWSWGGARAGSNETMRWRNAVLGKRVLVSGGGGGARRGMAFSFFGRLNRVRQAGLTVRRSGAGAKRAALQGPSSLRCLGGTRSEGSRPFGPGGGPAGRRRCSCP